jgi:AAA15 family ATPase/GTPase
MILQFSVSNFRSFRGLQTLNLTASNADKSLPGNLITPNLPGLKGRKWLKGAALYGPNASGKSTFIAALETLAKLVGTSASTTDATEPIRLIDPFALAPDQPQSPTAFRLVLVSANVRYEYRLAATRERIWHESLRAFPEGKEQLWYSRDWQPSSDTYQWTPENPSGFKRDKGREKYTLSNNLYLSKAVALGDTQLEPLFRWFKDHLVCIDLSARSPVIASSFTAEQLERNSSLAPSILTLLRHADLGITGAKVEREKPNPELLANLRRLLPEDMHDGLTDLHVHKIELSHSGLGQTSLPLAWETESAGTHRLFVLAGPWLDILNRGHTVCIDELDTSMHPLMVHALLRLVFSESNTSGAQILFTTHNPLLLDPTLMRRDQIWFTDKTEQGESHLYPLTNYKPRRGESLTRGYLSGRYGAIPFIPGGLLNTLNPLPAKP